ncbi:MAG: MBL fold metallo-hydrolase [Firmicutes bacterium]|nr:MBL fold metallo-hydrolase [Bacillota bacterium]
MQFTWHGSASYTIRAGGTEFLVDPSFSRKEEYGDWFLANPHAPDFPEYARNRRPNYVLITHGHPDHFDLHTVRKLWAEKGPVFVGSKDVTETIHREFAVPGDHLISLEPGGEVGVHELVKIRAFAGVHWFTGEEGRRSAEKFAKRPDRYGAMPCGGPMLSFLLETPEGRVFISGDTKLEGIPAVRADVAILCVGGQALNSVTKQPETPIITPEEARDALRRLGAGVVIPVHYDYDIFLGSLDLRDVKADLEQAPGKPRVIMAPYNQEIEL